MTRVILRLPLRVSGARRGGKARLEFLNAAEQTRSLLSPAGIFMTGWCVSVKGMSLWAAESTHTAGRRRRWRSEERGGARESVHNKANCLGQINKYSKALFSAGSSSPGGPAVPMARRRGIGEEMGFSLFLLRRSLALILRPLCSHISIPQWPDLS